METRPRFKQCFQYEVTGPARFAPGRLYDSPVRTGWLHRPLAEEELNPIAIFF